jgi:hypothetical protein
MKKHRFVPSPVAFVLRLGAAALALCLVQCSAEQPPDSTGEQDLGSISQATGTEHCGGISCTGVTECQTNLPLCASAASATCLTTAPRECAWKLNISAACPCMEHDVRLCLVGGTTPGVQVCTANGARTATFWGTCATTPTCTP